MTTMIARPPCDAGVILGGSVGAPCSPQTGRWVLAATILASSMVFIDSSAVNVALPVLQESLDASATEVQWVVEIYMLFLAALILVGGALGDRLGRRRVFVWGVWIFVLASVWCGLAPDPAQLIVARAVQGIGGALLVPGSLAIISASFDEASRGAAIGTWSGATAITTAVGPVIGGWLAGHESWRWVFLLNVPFALAVLLIAATRLPESHDPSATGPLDWAGAAVSVAALGLLVYGLIESANLGFEHPLVLATIAGGVLLCGVFIKIESSVSAPMMPLDLFRSRRFTGASLLTLLLYGALGGALFFLPFNLIQVQGYTPAEAGAAWLPFILIIAGLSRRIGALVPVVGARVLLITGPLVTAGGFALGALPGAAGSYWTTFFPSFVVMGVGMAVTVAPLVTVVMGSVESRRAGIASGINNAVSRAAGLLGLAVMGIIVLTVAHRELDRRLAASQVRPAVVEQLVQEGVSLAAATLPATATPEEARELNTAIDASFVAGFRFAMLTAAGLAAVSALVAAVTIGRG